MQFVKKLGSWSGFPKIIVNEIFDKTVQHRHVYITTEVTLLDMLGTKGTDNLQTRLKEKYSSVL